MSGKRCFIFQTIKLWVYRTEQMCVLILALFLSSHAIEARTAAPASTTGVPALGASIWITSNTTRPQLDHWMKLLARFHLSARLYMEPPPYKRSDTPPVHGPHWKTKLVAYLRPYDLTFAAADRYGVKIMLCLPTFWAPQNQVAWDRQKETVKFIVHRYCKNPALSLWGIVNEAHIYMTGSGNPASVADFPDALVVPRYQAWLAHKYSTINRLNRKWCTHFSAFKEVGPNTGIADNYYAKQQASFNNWWAYWRHYLAHFIVRMAAIVRKDDPNHPLSAEADNVMSNLAMQAQDIPSWRPAVTIMGVSLHPAWHFELLRRRSQFAMGTAFTCDEIRGFSYPKPFMLTELEGGTTIYSGGRRVDPTRQDIAQWTWTAIGSGARRIYYWLLNTSRTGIESGEWSMLNYQNQPSRRLVTAGSVANVIDAHERFFQNSHPVASPITIVLSMDAMTFQASLALNQPRFANSDAMIDEALGVYQAFLNLGIPVNIKSFSEFPWTEASTHGQVVILPDLSALTRQQAARITAFESNGNTVIATGLTGLWNPLYQLQTLSHFPLEMALGGNFQSVCNKGPDFPIAMRVHHAQLALSARHLIGVICNHRGNVLARKDGRILATENHLGKGTSFWIPSLVGTAAFYGRHRPLAQLMADITAQATRNMPFRFSGYQSHAVLRVLRSGSRYLTVITNGARSVAQCHLVSPLRLKRTVIWGKAAAISDGGIISLGGHQTLVLLWQPSAGRKQK